MALSKHEKKIQQLIDAVIADDMELVKQLLESGINPNCTLDTDKITPLHFAAQNNSYHVTPLLLTAGANIYAKTSPDGVTPLDVAKLHKHSKMVMLLANCKSNNADLAH